MFDNHSVLFTGLVFSCLLLCGCGGMWINDLWRDHVSQLDYVQLLSISMNLASPERSDNMEGLDAFVGAENTQKIVKWTEGIKLAWKAGEALVDKVQSRDLKVAEVVNQYRGVHGNKGNYAY